jgi:hypothetical protein
MPDSDALGNPTAGNRNSGSVSGQGLYRVQGTAGLYRQGDNGQPQTGCGTGGGFRKKLRIPKSTDKKQIQNKNGKKKNGKSKNGKTETEKPNTEKAKTEKTNTEKQKRKKQKRKKTNTEKQKRKKANKEKLQKEEQKLRSRYSCAAFLIAGLP